MASNKVNNRGFLGTKRRKENVRSLKVLKNKPIKKKETRIKQTFKNLHSPTSNRALE